ncbi:MAG TPA: glycosyltransferase family 39 protein [Methylomirabilota bacterium]|nr:glycosyltransferase family 39 protein [Methylomirabilota bacterium]
MVATLAVLLTVGEVLAITAYGVVLLQSAGYGPRQALPVALTATLGLLSFVAQSVFLLGVPSLLPVIEVSMLVAGAVLARPHWRGGRRFLESCRAHLREEWRTWVWVAPAWAYLGAASILIPEGNFDSMRYNLARVLLFEQEGTLLPTHFSEFNQVVFPVGGDILRHFVLRYGTDFGIAFFSLLALLNIAASNYALARAVASRASALTATLIVSSAPLLVYQATGTKPDILAAAVASTSLLLAFRIHQGPRALDLLLFVLALSFGLSVKTTYLAFGLPLALAVVAHLVRHPPAPGSLRIGWQRAGIAIVMVAVLSQSWLFVHNWRRWGNWAGPKEFAATYTHTDGAVGAGANLVRYAVQSIQVLSSTDEVARVMTGHTPSAAVEGVYRKTLEPLLGLKGMSSSRGISRLEITPRRWGDGENGAWFGPLGFLIVFPSLALAIARGRSLARLAGLVVAASVLLIARFVAWMPWNGRFFAMSFAGCGPCVAFAIERYAPGRRTQTALRVLACGVLYYGCCFNTAKDLLSPRDVLESIQAARPLPGLLRDSIWYRTRGGQDRDFYSRRHFRDDRVAIVSRELQAGSRVAVVVGANAWVYPFMQKRPDVRFLLVGHGQEPPASVDYVLCVNVACTRDRLPPDAEILWSASGSPAGRVGALAALGCPRGKGCPGS